MVGNRSTLARAQKAILRQCFGGAGWECPEILEALDRADSLYFDSVIQIHLDRWHRGRVALVGDAAFCPSLLAGEGAGLAMIGAYMLAGEVKRAGGDFRTACPSYQDRLKPSSSASSAKPSDSPVSSLQRRVLGFWSAT